MAKTTILIAIISILVLFSLAYIAFQDWKEEVYSRNTGCIGNDCGWKMDIFWKLFHFEKDVEDLLEKAKAGIRKR